jgi:hypothetical protein
MTDERAYVDKEIGPCVSCKNSYEIRTLDFDDRRSFWQTNPCTTCSYDPSLNERIKDVLQIHTNLSFRYSPGMGASKRNAEFNLVELTDLVLVEIRRAWPKPNPRVFKLALAKAKKDLGRIIEDKYSVDCSSCGVNYERGVIGSTGFIADYRTLWNNCPNCLYGINLEHEIKDCIGEKLEFRFFGDSGFSNNSKDVGNLISKLVLANWPKTDFILELLKGGVN